VLFPARCPVCGAHGPAPCGACRAALRPAPPLPPPPGVDSCRSFVAYAGVGRELVARFKYRNARASIGFLADGMAALVDASTVDAVTWVPTTPARRRQRGFDQGQLLARAVARRLGHRCRRLLVRGPGPAQTGQAQAERHRGPTIAAARGRPPARVLVVDDVVTTGASLAAAARALRSAGVREVTAVTAARTSLRRLHSGMAECGSVVESRRQPQAKRPT
jgi:predicted amidophosphoribosyltransferase